MKANLVFEVYLSGKDTDRTREAYRKAIFEAVIRLAKDFPSISGVHVEDPKYPEGPVEVVSIVTE